jgi:hypothetical protein
MTNSPPPRPPAGTPAQRGELLKFEPLTAALGYAGKGWPVFPVCGHDKRPLVKWKNEATTDAGTIRSWWQRWPLAMIGMPTGAASGVLVVDVDRKNGIDGLANLSAMGIDPFRDTTLVVETPSGGFHFYFKYDPRSPVKAGAIAPGVEVRAEGGFVVIPPSRPTAKRSRCSRMRNR